MYDIIVEKIDEVHMKIHVKDRGIALELNEYFSFRPHNYKFNPSYKNGWWDGYIRLFSLKTYHVYIGLLEDLIDFAKTMEYEIKISDDLCKEVEVDNDYLDNLVKKIDLNEAYELRDYQRDYILTAIRRKRMVTLSPTSSGKSLIMYLIMQHYNVNFEHKTLIIVPTTNLVKQLRGDFIEYGFDEKDIHIIHSGHEKSNEAQVVISTWQSIVNLDPEWFDEFDVVLGDECHKFQAKSLINVMEKLNNCPYRFGFTGTISSESKVSELVLKGLFGNLIRYITTKDLIDKGTVASLNIKGLVLKYSKEDIKEFNETVKEALKNITTNKGSKKYKTEIDFVINHNKRNKFIRNLAWSLKDQNNLILFNYKEHGDILYDLLKENNERKLHYIHGKIDADKRNEIRYLIDEDEEKNHDLLASLGTTSTGVNIKRLDNVILASPTKAEITVLQLIGRVLRRGKDSEASTVFDIADIISSNKSNENYLSRHFKKRLEIYSTEEFQFKIYQIDL